MKLHSLKLNHLLFPVLLFFCFPILATTFNMGPKETKVSLVSEWAKNDILGVWEYMAENVPYEYSKGIISITKVGKENKVKVTIGEFSMDGTNVIINKNEVRFQVFVEGQTVDVNLSANGNDLSGQGSTMDGAFLLSGKRKG